MQLGGERRETKNLIMRSYLWLLHTSCQVNDIRWGNLPRKMNRKIKMITEHVAPFFIATICFIEHISFTLFAFNFIQS